MFGVGLPELIVLAIIGVVFVLPFVLNYQLAKSRGKSVPLIMLLTVFFGLLVTFVLAFLPEVKEDGVKG